VLEAGPYAVIAGRDRVGQSCLEGPLVPSAVRGVAQGMAQAESDRCSHAGFPRQ
jgi:hypothetical protein